MDMISLVFSSLPFWAQVVILVVLLLPALKEAIQAMHKVFPRHGSRSPLPRSLYRRVDPYQQRLLLRQLRTRRVPSRTRVI